MPEEFNIECEINGKKVERTVRSTMTLSEFLREELGLTGTKIGCNKGRCGSCTVLLDGKAIKSCITLIPQVHGHSVTTIEGFSVQRKLTDLQEAFIEEGAVQCGFCTPGMIMTAEYLLRTNAHPDEEDIKEAIVGNLCRCTGYVKIIRAIKKAAEKRSKRQSDI